MKPLTISEETLLLSIWQLEENAYGVTIREKICEYISGDVGFGTLYNKLEQLVKKGYAVSFKGDPESIRGGKRKVFYRVTDDGLKALEAARELHQKMWTGIPRLIERS